MIFAVTVAFSLAAHKAYSAKVNAATQDLLSYSGSNEQEAVDSIGCSFRGRMSLRGR